MKTISKLYRVTSPFILPVIIASLIVTPAGAVGPTPGTAKVNEGNGACTRITTLGSTNEATIGSKKAAMQADFANRLTKITSEKSQVDQKVTTFRANLAKTFNDKVAKLEAQKNLSATQKAAIETFKTDMTTAEATREKAVDAARQTYREGLFQAINDRQVALTSAVEAFQAAVTDAFSTAASNCSDTGAMQTLKTTVKSARETLQTARSNNKVGSTVSQLAATRNASIKAADQAFAQSAASYGKTLAAALAANTNPSAQ